MDIQIADLIEGNPHKLPGTFQIQAPLLLFPLFQGLIQHCYQLLPGDRFHEIMERCHLVTLGNVVGVAGDEHNLHRLIIPAHLLCHGHAVHSAHFNIQQKDVPSFILRVPEQKAFRGWEALGLNADLMRLGPAVQDTLYIIGICIIVVANGNAISHVRTFFRYSCFGDCSDGAKDSLPAADGLFRGSLDQGLRSVFCLRQGFCDLKMDNM